MKSTISTSFVITSLVSLLLSTAGVNSATTGDWRTRSIYQIVTDRFSPASTTYPTCATDSKQWCGGTWQGIISKLDYIQGMGFDAIWISPVTSVISSSLTDGVSYHGYWQADPWQVNTQFGSPSDLQALSTALHDRDMLLMLDVVVQNVALAGNTASTFNPASPAIYGAYNSADDFHPFCWMNSSSTQYEMEQCWMGDTNVALPDLNTESSFVIETMQSWISQLVSNYSADGIRIDAANHVRYDFWPGFISASGTFAMGEVLDGDPLYVSGYQNKSYTSLTSVLNYPIYYDLTRAFTSSSGSMQDLVNMIDTLVYWMGDVTVLGVFCANADMPRPASFISDSALLTNMFSYLFVGDGIPIWYYGDEQSATGTTDPETRAAMWDFGSSPFNTGSTLYALAASLNAARRLAGQYSLTFYTDNMQVVSNDVNDVVLSKYPLLSVLSNAGSSSAAYSMTVATSYVAGTSVVNVLTCEISTVSSSQQLTVTVTGGQPQIFLPQGALTAAGGLCTSCVTASTCAQETASRVTGTTATATSK